MLCPIHGVQAPAGQVRPALGEVHGHGRTRVPAGGNATDERARGRVEFGIVIFIDQAKDRAQGRSCREFERLAATGTLLVVGWLLVGCWLVGCYCFYPGARSVCCYRVHCRYSRRFFYRHIRHSTFTRLFSHVIYPMRGAQQPSKKLKLQQQAVLMAQQYAQQQAQMQAQMQRQQEEPTLLPQRALLAPQDNIVENGTFRT